MRHSKTFVLIIVLAFTSISHAQTEDCEPSSTELYKDIQIYRATEKAKPTKGIVSARLQEDINLFKNSGFSLADKVQLLEAGFAKCHVRMSDQDYVQLEATIEAKVAQMSESN